jgi:hypothetical protein
MTSHGLVPRAHGRCRPYGREERAHRDLENRTERGFVRPAKGWRVQREVSPARATARSPVAWIAGRREIEDLKPIDNPIERVGASHRAAAEANADVASKEW